MKKIIFILFVLAVICLVGFAGYRHFSKVEPKNKKIKIGIILPLSGDAAYIGQASKSVLSLLQEDKNIDSDFEIILEDDQLKSHLTAVAANKLAVIDKVDILVTPSSEAANIVAPIVVRNDIYQFAFASVTDYTKNPKNYAFASNIKVEAEMLLQQIQKRGYKRLALVAQEETYMNGISDEIIKLVPQYGLEIVSNIKIWPTMRDFRMDVAKAEQNKPDIYIIQVRPPMLDIFAKQLREANMHVPMTSVYSFMFGVNSALYEGQFFLYYGTRNKDFDERFRKKYNREVDPIGSAAYATLSFIIDTVRATKNIKDGDAFQMVLEDIVRKNKSILGQLIIDGRCVSFYPVVKIIKNGQAVTVEE